MWSHHELAEPIVIWTRFLSGEQLLEKKMRSYQIADWGQPLVYDERPTPTPVGTEVLMRVTAAGICHSDLHIQDGFFDLGGGQRVDFAKLGAQLPLTLGHEIVGVVEAIGPDARDVEVGDARIAFPWIGCRNCAICIHEREQFCMTPKFLGARVNGGYSDHVIVPNSSYLVAYDGISSELACTYACAGLHRLQCDRQGWKSLRERLFADDRRRRCRLVGGAYGQGTDTR